MEVIDGGVGGWCGGKGAGRGWAGVDVVVSIDAFQTLFIQGKVALTKSNPHLHPHTSPTRSSPSNEGFM